MIYIITIVSTCILILSILLAEAKENWFVEFGLFIVVISTLTSMTLAFRSGRKGALAQKIEYTSFLPPIEDGKSHSFKFTAGLMGIDTHNPNKHLQNQIDEIKRVSIQDEQNFRTLNKFTDRRVDICLAQIRYHENVTLPKILGESSGSIIFSGVLTIIGSMYLAFPSGLYARFSVVADVVIPFFSTL